MSNERDEIYDIARSVIDGELGILVNGSDIDNTADSLSYAVLAAGYSKPRTITTPAEANALPDRAAFITPGEIIFRKWKGYYGEGKDAWERELGQMVPAELLSAEGHFPATVLFTPKESK